MILIRHDLLSKFGGFTDDHMAKPPRGVVGILVNQCANDSKNSEIRCLMKKEN
jgi:hypothetical protein